MENQKEKSSEQEFDYVVIMVKNTGGMRFKYSMIDYESNSLAPLLNNVVWPRLLDTVDFRTCVLKNVLYVIGGREKSTGMYLKDVLKYDPVLSRWRVCDSMHKARARHSVCASDGKIYVMGGCSSDHSILDTVEFYEPILDEWKMMEEKLPGARKDHACIAHENTILLSGGASPTQNANDNLWQMKAYLPDPYKLEFAYMWAENPEFVPQNLPNNLSKHTMLNGFHRLFVIGGVCHGLTQDGQTFIAESVATDIVSQQDSGQNAKPMVATTKNIESFKPNAKPKPELKSTTTNPKGKGSNKLVTSKTDLATVVESDLSKKTCHAWNRSLPDMSEPRCCAGTLIVGHKLYVVGGHRAEQEDKKSCNNIEYLHMKKKQWFMGFSLGEGDFSEVDCIVLRATRANTDFRPMRYSNCKWVLW